MIIRKYRWNIKSRNTDEDSLGTLLPAPGVGRRSLRSRTTGGEGRRGLVIQGAVGGCDCNQVASGRRASGHSPGKSIDSPRLACCVPTRDENSAARGNVTCFQNNSIFVTAAGANSRRRKFKIDLLSLINFGLANSNPMHTTGERFRLCFFSTVAMPCPPTNAKWFCFFDE